MLLRAVPIALALLGAPLFAVIASQALMGFSISGLDPAIVAMEIASLAESPVLVSLPLFVFAGEIMSRAGTSRRLMDLARAAVGFLPGGLGVVTVGVCAAFTALTGASGVTIVALGGLLYPALLREGFPKRYALGLVTTSGSLGLLFPPAIPVILYAVIARVPVEQMFLAALVPGLVMMLLLGLHAVAVGKRRRLPTQAFSLAELVRALKAAAFELPLPLVVIGGVYTGLIALSEAAAVIAGYALLVEVAIYRDVPVRDLLDALRRSMVLSGAILIILAVSLASTNYLVDQQVPARLFHLVKGLIGDTWSFLIALNLFLLALGAILDIFSAVVLVVPLLLPLAAQYDVGPMHLGVIFLANMEIGYCTPPVGINLFLAAHRFNEPVLGVCRSTLPFLGLLALVVLLVTYVPWVSQALPGWAS
ncbi:MAG: TRAP transporter large permease [Desulfovibrionaceae bacterium]